MTHAAGTRGLVESAPIRTTFEVLATRYSTVRDRAAHAMLHEGSVENGIARMRMVDQIELAPGERVELKPGGGHVMLTGVAKPLNPGDRFTLRLSFEKSGEKTVPVTVVGAGDR